MTIQIFLQHDYLDGTDSDKNKKDKKKKKKKESDDEGSKGEKSTAPTGDSVKKSETADSESTLRQRKGDEVVTAQKNPETDKDEQEDIKT